MFFVTRNEYKRLAARVAKLERKKAGLYSNRTIAAKEIMSNGENFDNVKLMKSLHKVGWKHSKQSINCLLACMCNDGIIERVYYGIYRIKG